MSDTAALALVLHLVYLILTFGVSAWLLNRSTGTTGYRGPSGRVGSAAWWGGILFTLALLAGLAAPVLQLLGLIHPVRALDHTVTPGRQPRRRAGRRHADNARRTGFPSPHSPEVARRRREYWST